MSWYKRAKNNEYPVAGDNIGGFELLDDVPNVGSINASLYDYTILPHIREVPMSDFDISGKTYNHKDNMYIAELGNIIMKSKKIKPLIVVCDDEGPYILEGWHRINALYNIGAKTFPALVVVDKENNSLDNGEKEG